MLGKIFIDGSDLSLKNVVDVARGGFEVALADEAKERILASRAYVEEIVTSGRQVYGVNTGFGEFANVAISAEDVACLQRNLLVSHACGVGAFLPEQVVRAMMLLRIKSLAAGFSGVRLVLIETLIEMLNKGIVPAVPEKGSLGASGDLAPLSHMCLPLIGEGIAFYGGELLKGAVAMEKAGITPIALAAKEGLALINGTQAMTAIGTLALYDAQNLAATADVAAALTMEALSGITCAFNPKLHALRPHKGQGDTAANILNLLKGSERVTKQGEKRTQDAYSLRCIPQIHGASKDALEYVEKTFLVEINSVTDNPIILGSDEAVSGGHFHGQPVALAMDFLAIAVAELANVSERRIERLVNPALSGGLPAFLTAKGGLNSGFMIAQYAAAALVSENKVLCHPASVDSIPSSAGQEDHVSMGTIAARKAAEITFNLKKVLAIELLCAAQGVDMAQPAKLGEGTSKAFKLVRSVSPHLGDDRELYIDIENVSDLIDSNLILDEISKN